MHELREQQQTRPQASAQADPAQEVRGSAARPTASSSTLCVDLYNRYSGEIFGFLQRWLGQASLAEDCLQETFLKVFRQSPSQLTQLEDPRAWLYTVARRAGLDALRLEQRNPSLFESSGALAALVCPDQSWQQMAQADRQRLVADVLAELKPEDRAVLLLYSSGSSFRNMAEVLGVTHPTAKKRFTDASAALTQRLMARRIFGPNI